MSAANANSLYSRIHVPTLWNALMVEFGETVDYWPANDVSQALQIGLIWMEGAADEDLSPGRYSWAKVQNADFPNGPLRGDSVQKNGVQYFVYRVDAYASGYSRVIFKEDPNG
jgi:hypothetical protein